MRSHLDRESALRANLGERGLAYPYSTMLLGKPVFHFDLNSGWLYSLQDASTVAEIVTMARSFADDEGYGEHNSLLQLVARRSELAGGENTVHWQRAYHVNANQRPDIWISLRDWLSNEGYPYKET